MSITNSNQNDPKIQEFIPNPQPTSNPLYQNEGQQNQEAFPLIDIYGTSTSLPPQNFADTSGLKLSKFQSNQPETQRGFKRQFSQILKIKGCGAAISENFNPSISPLYQRIEDIASGWLVCLVDVITGLTTKQALARLDAFYEPLTRSTRTLTITELKHTTMECFGFPEYVRKLSGLLTDQNLQNLSQTTL